MKYFILLTVCFVLLATGGCPAPPASENELKDLLAKVQQSPNTIHNLRTLRITWEEDHDMEANIYKKTFIYKYPDKYKMISSVEDGADQIQIYNGTEGIDITGASRCQLASESILELKLNILKAVINNPPAQYNNLILSSRKRKVLNHQCFYLTGSREIDGTQIEEEFFYDAVNFLPVRIITKIKFVSGEKLYTNDFYNYHQQDNMVLSALAIRYNPLKSIYRNIRYEINSEIPDSEFIIPEQ